MRPFLLPIKKYLSHLLIALFSLLPLSGKAIESTPQSVLTPHLDTLDGMIERREIRVLVHWSKIDYFIHEGQQHGIAAEMARDFEAFINHELHLKKTPISVLVVPVARDKLKDYLIDGRGDISFSFMRETPEYKDRIDFSDPIFTNESEWIVRSKTANPIRNDAELAGKTFHLRHTSSYVNILNTINTRLKKQGLKEATIEPLSEHLADADILEMMNAGLIEYTILDSERAQFLASLFPNITNETTFPLATNMSSGFAIRKGTPRLKALLNKFIKTHKVGTGYGNTLVKRYLKSNPWAKNALGKNELKRFNEIVSLFRHYGDMYNFDPLMITAQGFQESGLNQNRRSKVGAIGVMQLMPATGKSMKVGDVHKVEPNIHAGVKYMDQLADVYFNQPELDAVNRTLFCFAAYNAGPNRINKLRQVAKQRGLNPNIWFDNVELVVAQKVSHETVQYVMNINKYYIAYRMVDNQTKQRDSAKKALKEHSL